MASKDRENNTNKDSNKEKNKDNDQVAQQKNWEQRILN
jgi:hypothetical protein